LQVLARALVREHGGAVPATLEGLLALPGIGDYTARAVLSFAFGQDVAVVDTNVARFLHRLYGLPPPLPPYPARSAGLRRLAHGLLPPGQARAFNLAVLDLCAQVCVPRTPRCAACPIRDHCATGSGAFTLDASR
jgi:A/G-specific adenine glycosylase